MHVSLLFPSRFLKSEEFKGKDVTLTIKGVTVEELEGDNGEKKAKGIVSFVERDKLLVLNKTNSQSIVAMFGSETDGWRGKQVTFYPAPHVDQRTKEKGTAIRVRGSPMLAANLTYTQKLPRKKDVQVTLKKTAGRVAQQSAAPVPPPPEPPPEEDFGPEPPPDMILPGQEGFSHG